MIKIANNLTVLCQTRHKQSFTVPTQEQQMLAALDPVGFNENSNYQFTNMLQGGLLGGGVGALAGLPFGGVGAGPGILGGALAGNISGKLLSGLTKDNIAEAFNKNTPVYQQLIAKLQKAQKEGR